MANVDTIRAQVAAGKALIADPDPVESQIKELISKIDGLITIIDGGVVDLTDGAPLAQVADDARALALKKFLATLPPLEPDTKILIESQPKALNVASNAICAQLLFHYAGVHEIVMMNPRAKNKIAFREDMTLSAIKGNRPGRSHSYASNKKHARENFIYFCDTFDYNIHKNIPRRHHSDIGDAFMQICAYVVGQN